MRASEDAESFASRDFDSDSGDDVTIVEGNVSNCSLCGAQAPAQGYWSCAECTFTNAIDADVCAMCGICDSRRKMQGKGKTMQFMIWMMSEFEQAGE